jgi:hypothetical protein
MVGGWVWDLANARGSVKKKTAGPSGRERGSAWQNPNTPVFSWIGLELYSFPPPHFSRKINADVQIIFFQQKDSLNVISVPRL